MIWAYYGHLEYQYDHLIIQDAHMEALHRKVNMAILTPNLPHLGMPYGA